MRLLPTVHWQSNCQPLRTHIQQPECQAGKSSKKAGFIDKFPIRISTLSTYKTASLTLEMWLDAAIINGFVAEFHKAGVGVARPCSRKAKGK
jgi:hypothetical protein